MPLSMSRRGVSSCLPDGVVEDRRSKNTSQERRTTYFALNYNWFGEAGEFSKIFYIFYEWNY